MEQELGPGIAEALARTADQLREDADALDHFAEELAEELAEHADAGLSLPVAALEANPPALRQRLIRLAVAAEFHVALTPGADARGRPPGHRLARAESARSAWR